MGAEIIPGITADPDVAFGKPVVAGTRTPIAIILGELAGGATGEDLQREYDLTPDQVRAVLAYAAWLANQEDWSRRAPLPHIPPDRDLNDLLT